MQDFFHQKYLRPYFWRSSHERVGFKGLWISKRNEVGRIVHEEIRFRDNMGLTSWDGVHQLGCCISTFLYQQAMRIWALPDAIILTEMRLQNATKSIGMTRDPMFLHQTFVTQAIDIMKWIRTCFYFLCPLTSWSQEMKQHFFLLHITWSKRFNAKR